MMTLNTIPDLPAHSPATTEATPPAVVPPAPPARAFLNGRQLAAALGVSRRTLTTWNQRRIIPSIRVGRVLRYELEAVKTALRSHGRSAARPSASPASAPRIGDDSGTTAAV